MRGQKDPCPTFCQEEVTPLGSDSALVDVISATFPRSQQHLCLDSDNRALL